MGEGFLVAMDAGRYGIQGALAHEIQRQVCVPQQDGYGDEDRLRESSISGREEARQMGAGKN